MSINFIELFLKDEPGALQTVTEIFDKGGIDILSISSSGEEEYVPVSLVVNHTEKAVHELSRLGYEFDVEEGIAFVVPHHPGGLNSVLRLLSEAYINVISIFSVPHSNIQEIIIVVRVNDPEKAEAVLKKNWVKLLDIDDLIK